MEDPTLCPDETAAVEPRIPGEAPGGSLFVRKRSTRSLFKRFK